MTAPTVIAQHLAQAVAQVDHVQEVITGELEAIGDRQIDHAFLADLLHQHRQAQATLRAVLWEHRHAIAHALTASERKGTNP